MSETPRSSRSWAARQSRLDSHFGTRKRSRGRLEDKLRRVALDPDSPNKRLRNDVATPEKQRPPRKGTQPSPLGDFARLPPELRRHFFAAAGPDPAADLARTSRTLHWEIQVSRLEETA